MALSATAVTTVAKVKAFLGLDDRDSSYATDAIDIYYDSNAGAGSTGTVEVRENTIIGVSTGGTGFTLTLTDISNDTITELITVINAVAGWVATALTYGDAVSASLIEKASTSVFGVANRLKLTIPNDRKVELIIEGVTTEIERYLDRGIVSRAYDEIYWVDGDRQLILKQPEVTGFTNLFIDNQAMMTVRYTGTDPRATVEVTDTGVILRSRTGATVTTTSTTTLFSTSNSLALMEIVIDAVAGWAATIPTGVNGAEPSAFLVRTGVQSTKDLIVTLYGWLDYENEYQVDYESGLVTLNGALWPYTSFIGGGGRGHLRIMYTAGYVTVPSDLELVAWEMAAHEWHALARDTSLQSESIGSYSYTLAGGGLDAEAARPWRNRLASYRRLLP